MKSQLTADQLEMHAQKIAAEVNLLIERLKLPHPEIEFRRDLDGVSGAEYLVAKMIGEILLSGKANVIGLVRCDEEVDE